MKNEPHVPPKHQFEHAAPTVIHHPEEDLPVLAKWLKHGLDQGPRFWTALIGGIAVILAIVVLMNMWDSGKSGESEAWLRLETAKTPGERVDVAKEFATSKASLWGVYQAAGDYYSQGFMDLPRNKDAALPLLRKALDLFEEVAEDPKAPAELARAASFGKARTLEARNELDKAIAAYDKVATTWPNSDEATQAKQLAATLKKPETVAFYKELYSLKPTKTELPAPGSDLLGLPAGHPDLDGPISPAPALPGMINLKPGATTSPTTVDLPPVIPDAPATDAKKPAGDAKKAEPPAKPAAPAAKPAGDAKKAEPPAKPATTPAKPAATKVAEPPSKPNSTAPAAPKAPQTDAKPK